MTEPPSAKLATALLEKMLVKFTRPFEGGFANGYVLDIGPDWFLLALVDDTIRFNGFQCFRLSDVRELQAPHRYAAVAESALRMRGERLPTKPPVSVGSIEELLLSAGRLFPLVTIHREDIDPDFCRIGHVIGVQHGKLSLLEINPDASWDTEASEYPICDITRVDFGGVVWLAVISEISSFPRPRSTPDPMLRFHPATRESAVRSPLGAVQLRGDCGARTLVVRHAAAVMASDEALRQLAVDLDVAFERPDAAATNVVWCVVHDWDDWGGSPPIAEGFWLDPRLAGRGIVPASVDAVLLGNAERLPVRGRRG